MERIKQAWADFWESEAERRILWLPVLFATGIALYFALADEPPQGPLLLVTVILLLLALWTPRRLRPIRVVIVALCLIALGTGYASLYTARHHAPVMRQAMTPRPVTGTLTDIERVENGLRFTLKDVAIAGVKPEATPHHVRLSLRLKPTDTTPLPMIGSRIQLLAGLLPPMGPAMPGGFDFARYFFFRDIGAIGYGLPPWKVQEEAPQRGWEAKFQQWRFALTERIIAQLGPRDGPIAAGLITGEDRAIAEEDFKILRASNLYHIIAISGGHMVVIAGVIFVALRYFFLLLPGNFGLMPRAKSVAAMLTLIMVTLYLLVTGMPISAVRAYVMIALLLFAVIVGREVDAMRSLLLAALIMLLADPSDLLEPGFVLSFVATLAIIALAETRWLRAHAHEQPKHRMLIELIIASLLISVVAEGATTLPVLSMFNTVAPYGVLANALATPLVALVIMPTVALFFILLPFGAESFALMLMDYGIRAMMGIAQFISSLPHAQLFAPSPPAWGMALFMAGLLMLCLLRHRLRYAGAGLMLLGFASLLTVRVPDLLVGPELRQIVLRTPEGPVLARGRTDAMLPELWANGLGYEHLPPVARDSASWRCDRTSCVATIHEKYIAFPEQAMAFGEDCAASDLVITRLRLYDCKAPMLGPSALAQGGVHAFWFGRTIWHETSADWQGYRPWSSSWK